MMNNIIIIQRLYAQEGFYLWQTILLRPVSYTHLDVYKRQIIRSILLSLPDKTASISLMRLIRISALLDGTGKSSFKCSAEGISFLNVKLI